MLYSFSVNLVLTILHGRLRGKLRHFNEYISVCFAHIIISLSGISSLDAGVSGKMGLRTLIYYFATTFAAIIVGIIFVLAIHPGTDILKDELMVGTQGNKVTTLDAILDLIR